MQRNNFVFLFGNITHYTTRTLEVDNQPTQVMEIQLLTDEAAKGGCHRVFVTGQQAMELQHFLAASSDEPLEVTVLGHLHSSGNNVAVMASRVTAVVPKSVRQKAVKQIRETESRTSKFRLAR